MSKFIVFGDNIINTNSIKRIFKASKFKDDYRLVLLMTDNTSLEINIVSFEIMNQIFVAISNELVASEYPVIPKV